MKKLIKKGFLLMLFPIFLSSFSLNSVMAQSSISLSIGYQDFYDGLSPYGTWIDYPAYGNVWHPMIDGDFRPYLTNGYWDYSGNGWMWMSNYNWGWAPFHYGRWIYDDFYGWLWIPGYEWSPAWVTWGSFDDYYAWAPLSPLVNVGVQFSLWRPDAFYWNICSRDHIYDRNIFNEVVQRNSVPNFVNRISIINNFSTTRFHNQYYDRGPDVKDVERFTNRKITPATIRDVNNSSIAKHQGNEIHVYRPAIINPQPREFRRADKNSFSQESNNSERPLFDRNQQRDNVNRLPVQRAPENIFRTGRQENFRGGNRKNSRN